MRLNSKSLLVLATIAVVIAIVIYPKEGILVRERPEGCPEGYTPVYINGQEICSPPECPEGYFKDERGLCQRDPYDPYITETIPFTVSEVPSVLLIGIMAGLGVGVLALAHRRRR